jgi:hypothetical protein
MRTITRLQQDEYKVPILGRGLLRSQNRLVRLQLEMPLLKGST